MGCYFIGHLSVNVLYNCIENTLSLNHKCFTYRDMVCDPFKPIYIFSLCSRTRRYLSCIEIVLTF